ncbi:MAG: invertase, partial [Verrucomicrobiota bacterium]
MKAKRTMVVAGFCLILSRSLLPADELVIADFESGTYEGWTVTGDAFGPAPAAGTLANQMPVSGFRGKRLVNTFHQGDKTVGTATSAPFKIERPYL